MAADFRMCKFRVNSDASSHLKSRGVGGAWRKRSTFCAKTLWLTSAVVAPSLGLRLQAAA